MYKLIAFTSSSDIVNKAYVENQLQAIAKLHPELAIEHVNETDARLSLFISRADRFPAFLITKLDRRKATTNGKVTFEQLSDWVNSNIG